MLEIKQFFNCLHFALKCFSAEKNFYLTQIIKQLQCENNHKEINRLNKQSNGKTNIK